MPEKRMKSVSRSSISDEFEVASECPIPIIPKGGARVKVFYAGACYTDLQVQKSGQRRLRSPGVQDTSLFPGYEVSGIVDEVCNTVVANSPVQTGDRVIVYPDDTSEKSVQDGAYAEYITVKDLNNIIRVPPSLPLEVAALLPCGALRAYAAIQRAKPFIEMKVAASQGMTNILIVGAGGLGLWTLKLAQYLITDCSRVKITVADTNIEKLMIAKDHGCFDVIHWNDQIHEEYILERTKDVCQGGVDIVIDFVSSPRTINRSMKVLKQEGIILVGGNSKYEVSFCLESLAQKNHSILGVQRGTREQLQELVHIFEKGEIEAPVYKIFPVDEANRVFEMLNECKINGRAILQICPEEAEEDEEGEFSVFLPSTESEEKLSSMAQSFANSG